jgi:4-amino-4-deoxy-L-arabinose transferase-like glycosyltransferase
MTVDLLALLAANACFLAAGLGITRATGWWLAPEEALGAVGVSYVVGVAAVGVVSCLLLIAGTALTLVQVLVLAAALAALGLVRGRGAAGTRPRHASPIGRVLLVPGVVVAVVLAALAVDFWYQPLWKYDAWTFWTPKARALVELDGLDPDWFTAADLLNPDYPMLVPALEAILFRFAGVAPEVLDYQSWLLVAGFALAVLELVRRRGVPLVLSGWTIAMAITAPSLGIQAATAEADVPLAVFVACAAGFGLVWLEERRLGALVLVGVLLAAAFASKVEGTIFAVALLLPLAALAWRSSRRDGLLAVAAGVAAFAVTLLPWRLWLAAHDVENQATLGRVTDLGLLRDEAERVPEAAGTMVWELVDPRSWLLVVPMALVAAVLALRAGRLRGALLLASSLTLAVLGLVLAYWTSPLELDFHLLTSSSRVVTAPVLLAAALTPFLLADAAAGRGELEGDRAPGA